MKEDILKIINHYGVKHQLKYFQSEVFELAEAIISYECAVDSNYIHNCKSLICYDLESFKNHIAEEIADVMVMLKQFQYYYEIPDKEIEDVIKYKTQRQLERIKIEEVNKDVRAMGEEKKNRR